LHDVDLSGNFFSSLSPFRGWLSPSLNRLDLSSNQVARIFEEADKDATSALTWKAIDLRGNRLTEIPDDPRLDAPQLIGLDLSDNPLAGAAGAGRLPALERLDLRETLMTECPLLPADKCQF
jgi:Leucine-rich repeat (LRR) protein